ncbi:MAG TPA: patatin-like phospholipase family protein, partial [Terriglobia bacterium]|nr:patatin-like phospholipase family protein [Terriglobia bacterium]
ATATSEVLASNGVRTLIANHLGVDVKRVTDEAHFTDDLGADWLDRLELMIVIEDRFAIYRFLAEHNAQDKVKVISGTSIGAWNALFWLSDLIESDRGWDERSVHENWWRSINLRSLVAPSWYVPFCRNAFFETTPWQQTFDDIFGQDDVKQQILKSGIDFYLTRSDVRSGKLQCTTKL